MAIQDTLASVSYPHLLFTAFALATAYVASVIFYRLYLHPLAKYPGPLFARISDIPSYLCTNKQDRHVWLLQLQEQYGPTFRYRPNAVLMNSPSAYRTIFGNKGNVRKTDAFYRTFPHNIEITNTWNVTDISAHARKRRVLNNAFSDRALRGMETFVHSNTDRWLELIKDQTSKSGTGWSKSLNMAHEVNYLVFDILGDLCFGKQFNMKEPDSDIKHVPELMASFVELLHPIAFSPFAEWWVWMKPRGLDWLLTFAVPEKLKRWQAFVSKNLENRTKVEEEVSKGMRPARQDFFHYLFGQKDPETGELGYNLHELYGECELLTIAGSDTTAIVTAALTFYLARNPKIQAKLAKEITSTFSSPSEIAAGAKLHGCRYLRAVIYETLRMAPPVPAELAREVLPGGTTVDGEFFPTGVELSTCLYCLSYNKEVYPSPYKFRPERWLTTEEDPEGSSPEEVELAESGHCAFSTGTRGCVGKNMAWMEMQIVLGKMIHGFEMKQDSSNLIGGGGASLREGHREVEQYQLYDAFVAMRDGPMIQFKERGSA